MKNKQLKYTKKKVLDLVNGSLSSQLCLQSYFKKKFHKAEEKLRIKYNKN